jgi:hypothetical protein
MSQPYTTLTLMLLAAVAAGCAPAVTTREPARAAVLLVSLEDGSMIAQDIRINADVCLKANEDAATTCLTRGEPIIAADGQHIIGYHLQRTEIELYPGD